MLSSRCSFGLIAVGVLLTCALAARSDEWVNCRRDASTGQLLWLRGKSTEFLKKAEYRPGAPNPDLGTCLVSKEQLREAHGLRFYSLLGLGL